MGRIARVRAKRAEGDGSQPRQDPDRHFKKRNGPITRRDDDSDTLLESSKLEFDTLSLVRVLFLLAALAQAQAPNKGYVVKADSATVWLDLTAADGAAPGRGFEVYAQGEELRHPITGKSLGRVEKTIASGSIREVFAKYSTGVLNSGAAVKTGQRVKLAAPVPAPAEPASPAPAATQAGVPARHSAKIRGATLDFMAAGMAVGDFSGEGRPQIAVAGDDMVRLYAYPGTDPRVLAEYKLNGTGQRIVSLDAQDVDGDGKAELFASFYDEGFHRFETRVLRLENGRWVKDADLPFLVHAYQDPSGARLIAAQRIVDDRSFPLGAIYPLSYANGKFTEGKPALHYRRADWLYGFTTVGLPGGDSAVVTVTNVHALRAQLKKNYWRSPDDDYGQTPVRVRWDERLLEFHPSMPAAYGSSGFEALYTARNVAALGGLASPFGIFNHGEIQRKRWNGLAFEAEWTAEIPGCVQELALVSPEPGRRELAALVRGAAGQSAIWIFDL